MFPPQAPWTGLGQLESEIRDVKSILSRKADDCEVRSAVSRVDSLERTIGEVRSDIDRISAWMQRVQENLRAAAEN